MFKLNAKFDADSLLYSVILNVTADITHVHSMAFTAPTDQYSEVIIVHSCAIQSTLLGFQVTLTSHKPFLLC